MRSVPEAARPGGQQSEEPANLGHGAVPPTRDEGDCCSDVDGRMVVGSNHGARASGACGGGPTGGVAHSWRYDGEAGALHPRCDRPTRLKCECGAVTVARCGATRESKCQPCAHSHRLRLREVIMSGVRGREVGSYFFVTITAPGADRLPWDPESCQHGPEVECSGNRGCRVDRFDGAVWNGTAPRRWSWFVTYLRRRLGDLQYAGVWEDQERGVLHRHFVLRVESPTTEKRVMAAVRNSARRWGFGSQYDVRGITETAGREAWYIASYATKTVDRMGERRMLDVRTGELKPAGRGFRSWSCSRRWGDTVKTVRSRQQAWARSVSASVSERGGGAALDVNSDISTESVVEMFRACGIEVVPVLL